MMQLMLNIYTFYAVFDLVRQYCVLCDGAAVSQIETFSTGSLEKAEVALYFARDVFSLYI